MKKLKKTRAKYGWKNVLWKLALKNTGLQQSDDVKRGLSSHFVNIASCIAQQKRRRQIRVFTQDGSLFLRWITPREFQRSSSSWDLPGSFDIAFHNWWAAKPDWHALKRGAKTVIIFRGQKLEVWGGEGRVMWQIRVRGWRWMRNEASGYEMASMINQNDSLYVSRKFTIQKILHPVV